MKREDWPEIGTKLYFVCEHIYNTEERTANKEYVVCSGKLTNYIENSSWTSMRIVDPGPYGYKIVSYYKPRKLGRLCFIRKRGPRSWPNSELTMMIRSGARCHHLCADHGNIYWRKQMKLYDNDVYREEFMEIVYGVLSGDETNDRANQIIDAFDNAPQVETANLLANDPLTLEQLREMDGEPVWVHPLDRDGEDIWAFVDSACEEVRIFTTRFSTKCTGILRHFRTYGKNWIAYRRKPEEQSC